MALNGNPRRVKYAECSTSPLYGMIQIRKYDAAHKKSDLSTIIHGFVSDRLSAGKSTGYPKVAGERSPYPSILPFGFSPQV